MNDQLRKPNLFIIGAMKSGTTSLHEYLDSHPQISMSQIKEPGFFVNELTLGMGEDWYMSLFDRGIRYQYIGESSTHYTKLPVYTGVPERLFRFNSDVRLIYIMRNPFERTVSHYWHAVRDLYHGGERRSPFKAVTEKPEYLAFSDYAMQLEPYIRTFGRDSLYVLTFEALVQNPQSEVDRIYEWLGLPEHPIALESQKAHNQKPKDIVGIGGAGILNRIEFSRSWHSLSPYIPKVLKKLARKLAYKPIDETVVANEIERLQQEVAGLQRRQIDNLRQLLDRDFPEWAV